MSESSQMLREKTSELETAVSQAQEELARADASRRTEAHHKLSALVREARGWLDSHERPEGDEQAETAATRKAEGFLHDIRMHRTAL